MGRSGNPHGRPKGRRNLKTDLQDELRQRIKIREDGRTHKISKQQALVKTLFAKGLNGDIRALDRALSLIERYLSTDAAEGLNPNLSSEDREIIENFRNLLLPGQNGSSARGSDGKNVEGYPDPSEDLE
jgi:hypothetical protein